MPDLKSLLTFKESIKVEVWRGDRGYYTLAPDEVPAVEDLVVNDGRIFMAKRIGANVDSPMAHMAIGSGTTAPALTDVALVNEIRSAQVAGAIGRKLLAINSAITNNVYTAVATWGGFADTVMSLSITEALIANGSATSQGSTFQRVTFAAVVLANSDFLKLTCETVVGSNVI